MATRRSKRQSKVVVSEAAEEERSINTEGQTETVGTGEDAESAEMNQDEENGDEQDPQMVAVIEVKGNTSTVNVSWEKKIEEGEGDDSEGRSTAEEQTEGVSSADAVGGTDTTPSESPQTKMEQESPMDAASEGNEDTPTVTVTLAKQNEEEQSGDIKQESNESEPMVVKAETVNGKRKANSNVKTSPPKKTKRINDGFCLFVGNLNKSKTFEELKDSLATYFLTHSVLVQDIRLDRSKKHAHVDLASEIDLTKALTLNGEMILDKPVKIAEAKVKSEDKVKAPQVDKKVARNARCLFLKNVPYNATKEDILKVFQKGIAVRFPGGAESPSQGIAFVEFQNKSIAKKVRQRKQGVKMQGRVLIVDSVGESNVPKVTKAEDKNTKAPPPPNNILFVSNLSPNVKEKNLNGIFQKAVGIKMPQSKGKSKGYAFIEFATVADAEEALQASKSVKICKRAVRVQFFEMRAKPEAGTVQLKTLIVMRLAKETTAETLKNAFDGALSARVTVDKVTGLSKRFGFVEFESEEHCKAVKDAMQDCEIDGSKVTVAYARSEGGRQGARGGGQPAGRGAGRGGKGSRGGKGRAAVTPQAAVTDVENKG